MKIGILANPIKDPQGTVLARVKSFFNESAIEVLTWMDDDWIGHKPLEDLKDCNYMLSLGGDGTFLNAVHLAYPHDIPVLGVNLGSLGFLADVDVHHLETDLQHLIKGPEIIESRMMLQVVVREGEQVLKQFYALNDAVLTRGAQQRILPIEFFIQQSAIEVIPCDGLIVSTPTGSTAYAMSAGGPIVDPKISLLQVTPICPHTLHNRSYILSADYEVSMRIPDYPYTADLSVDGRTNIKITSDQTIHISRAKKSLKMPKLHKQLFFETLPEKITGRGYQHRL